jgi:hypothetical protein
MLRFPGSYPLFTIVITALFAHVVRALHALAPRALLDRDGRRGLVRVAGALLSLGCTALRDGHVLVLVECRAYQETITEAGRGLTAELPNGFRL